MDKDYIIQLLQRYFTNQATHTEREALFAEVEKYKNNSDWEELLTSVLPQLEEEKQYDPERYQSIITKILKPKARIVPLYRKKAFKWAAAACIVLVTGYGLWVTSKKSEVGSQKSEVAKTHDVPAPKETRAVITLANGSKVYLDSVDNGTIAQESNVNVIKTADGKLVYEGSKVSPTGRDLEGAYNTLFNPRGSKVIDMQLSDGSHVWLNAGSSVKYPVAFVGNERKVEITGEAYFEVTHDASKPFVVSKGGVSVQVLGTHFNVNAYDDEESLKVTLLEGSVQVSAKLPGLPFSAVKIRPGQQAVVKPDSPLTIDHSPDLDAVMAWKNGRFELAGSTIEPIMREVARWYDVDIEYKANITQHFGGSVSRNASISEVLKALEATGSVKFKIEGKKIIVSK